MKKIFILLAFITGVAGLSGQDSLPDLSGRTYSFTRIEPMLSIDRLSFQDANNFTWEMVAGDYTARQGTYTVGKDKGGLFIDFTYKEDFGGNNLDEQDWQKKRLHIDLADSMLITYSDSKRTEMGSIYSTAGYKEVNYSPRASSEYKEVIKGKTVIYSAAHLKDRDTRMFWAEGKKSDGKGEYIDITFIPPDELDTPDFDGLYTLKACLFVNGAAYPADLYKKNNRVRQMVLECDNGEKVTLNIKDTREPQLLLLKIKSKVKSARLKITAVYKGTHWNDLCISKLIFLH